MSSSTAQPACFDRPSVNASCKLLSCAALSLALTLLTFGAIADSVTAGGSQSNVAAAAVALVASR